MKNKSRTGQYTCNEYRDEMILLGLQQRLASPDISPAEKERILTEIQEVEKKMGLT